MREQRRRGCADVGRMDKPVKSKVFAGSGRRSAAWPQHALLQCHYGMMVNSAICMIDNATLLHVCKRQTHLTTSCATGMASHATVVAGAVQTAMT
eukprot:2804290-Amphidinium_carterae.1